MVGDATTMERCVRSFETTRRKVSLGFIVIYYANNAKDVRHSFPQGGGARKVILTSSHKNAKGDARKGAGEGLFATELANHPFFFTSRIYGAFTWLRLFE